jgi:hypothetical protein
MPIEIDCPNPQCTSKLKLPSDPPPKKRDRGVCPVCFCTWEVEREQPLKLRYLGNEG